MKPQITIIFPLITTFKLGLFVYGGQNIGFIKPRPAPTMKWFAVMNPQFAGPWPRHTDDETEQNVDQYFPKDGG